MPSDAQSSTCQEWEEVRNRLERVGSRAILPLYQEHTGVADLLMARGRPSITLLLQEVGCADLHGLSLAFLESDATYNQQTDLFHSLCILRFSPSSLVFKMSFTQCLFCVNPANAKQKKLREGEA